jgi:hypothetical protein
VAQWLNHLGIRATRGLLDISGKLPYRDVEEMFKELYKLDNKIGPRERALIHNALQRSSSAR